jgi:sugar phosphate isomerase/epimerase
LQKYGIGDLEVAPTRYGTWGEVVDAESIRAKVESFGLRVCSTQAVFFGMSTNLFDDSDGFEAHMQCVIELTARFGAKWIVLGSPKNRISPAGETEEVRTIAIQVLERIGKYAVVNFSDVIVCLEPNSKKYGCNFVTNLAEACDVLQNVASRNVGITLNTGNAEMEGEGVGKWLIGAHRKQRQRSSCLELFCLITSCTCSRLLGL